MCEYQRGPVEIIPEKTQDINLDGQLYISRSTCHFVSTVVTQNPRVSATAKDGNTKPERGEPVTVDLGLNQPMKAQSPQWVGYATADKESFHAKPPRRKETVTPSLRDPRGNTCSSV
jgi:hypothetical protein